MTRGWKSAVETAEKVVVPKPKKVTTFKTHLKDSMTKKKASKPPKPSVPAEELSASVIRRNNKGRAAIIELVQALMDKDDETFPDTPVFAEDGRCRLRFDGAENITWLEIRDGAAAAFEIMCLRCIL